MILRGIPCQKTLRQQVVILNIAGCIVSWKSKKQNILVQYAIETEMIALDIASEEAIW